MRPSRSARRTKRSLALCLLLSMSFCACSGSKDSPTPESFGKRFKLADQEVPGWSESTDRSAYSVWTPENLEQKIDGANMPYLKNGMRFAMYQDLVGGDTRLCTLTAMDFENTEAASKMFADKTKFLGDSSPVGSFEASTALGSPGLTSLTVYAHFDAYYFEVMLDGYASQDAANGDVDPFLKAMQKRSQ